MSSPAVTATISTETEATENRETRVDTAELKSDAQTLGATGLVAAAMIGVAHAELAAVVTAVVTAVATVPLWVRARHLER